MNIEKGQELFPPALSYGINPAAVLPKTMTIAVEGTDQTEMLRAIMAISARPPSAS